MPTNNDTLREWIEAKLTELEPLALREHFTCEDAWYNCPMSEEGSADEFKPKGMCDCGADEHNAKAIEAHRAVRMLLRHRGNTTCGSVLP